MCEHCLLCVLNSDDTTIRWYGVHCNLWNDALHAMWNKIWSNLVSKSQVGMSTMWDVSWEARMGVSCCWVSIWRRLWVFSLQMENVEMLNLLLWQASSCAREIWEKGVCSEWCGCGFVSAGTLGYKCNCGVSARREQESGLWTTTTGTYWHSQKWIMSCMFHRNGCTDQQTK